MTGKDTTGKAKRPKRSAKVIPIKSGMKAPQKAAEKPLHSPARRVGNGLTIKQERFCQAYAACGNGTEAYRQVYNAGKMKPAVINQKSFELLSNAKITVRVESIRAALAKACAVSVESLSAELTEAMELARAANQPGAFVQAVMARAKLHGLIVERVENKTTQFVVAAPEPDATTEEWIAGIEAKLA